VKKKKMSIDDLKKEVEKAIENLWNECEREYKGGYRFHYHYKGKLGRLGNEKTHLLT